MAQQHDVKDRWQALIQKALHLDRKRILQQHKEDFRPKSIGKDEHRMSKENLQSTGLTKDERQTSSEAHSKDHSQAETGNPHDRSNQSAKPMLMLHRSSYRASQDAPQLDVFIERCEKEKPKLDEKLFHIKELMMGLAERLVDLDTKCLQLE